MELKSSKKIDVNRWELEIFVSPEDFNKEVDKAFNRQKGKISIPGFRKGKAPRKFIEKFYGEGVFYEDAVNAIYPYAVDEAAKKAGIELVDDHIDFEMVKMGKDDGLDFKVKVTVMPEVTVENYKGIKVSKQESTKVTEKDVESEIELIRSKNSRLITVEDKPAEMGDITNINFEGFVDGTPFENGKAEEVALELGKKQFIAGFEEQVVGHKTGEEFEINVKFPDDYHAENLAGKDAMFKIKINKIQKKELPKFDDEFVKDISEFDTIDEFKKDLKKKIAENKKHQAKHKFENEAINEFIKLVKADIPEALIKNKIKELLRDFDYRLKPQGLNLKDYVKYTGTTQERLEETFRPQAESGVKLSLGLKKVAELEGIKVSDEDIENEYKKLAEAYKLKPEQVKNFVMKEDLEKDLLKEKAMELIKNSAVEK